MPRVLIKTRDEVRSFEVDKLLEGFGEEHIAITEEFPVSTSLRAIKKMSQNTYRICLEVQNFKTDMRTSGVSVSDYCREVKSAINSYISNDSLKSIVSGQPEVLVTYIEDGVYFYCEVREQNDGVLRLSTNSVQMFYNYSSNCDLENHSGLYISPNVYDSGNLCLGNNSGNFDRHTFRTLDDLNSVYTHFLDSIFNRDLSNTYMNDRQKNSVVTHILQEAVKQDHPMSQVASELLRNDFRLNSSSAYCWIYLCNIFAVPTSVMGRAFR